MAKPDDCKVCARLTKKAGAPTKCKRHGGVKRKAKSPEAKRPPKPEPVVANGNGKFAAHITGLKQAVAAGLAAKAELDSYKASLA